LLVWPSDCGRRREWVERYGGANFKAGNGSRAATLMSVAAFLRLIVIMIAAIVVKVQR
jgi:hypothetical protein